MLVRKFFLYLASNKPTKFELSVKGISVCFATGNWIPSQLFRFRLQRGANKNYKTIEKKYNTKMTYRNINQLFDDRLITS